jgi:hypothetical protein
MAGNAFWRVTFSLNVRSHLPPSQGGKYSGFGNSAFNPPPRSQSNNDFYETSIGGLSNVIRPRLILLGPSWQSLKPVTFFVLQSLSAFSVGASKLTGQVAEVGWKFTQVASQKVSEVSGTVSEKVIVSFSSLSTSSSPLCSFPFFTLPGVTKKIAHLILVP